jgi:hypothetical protein
VAVPGEVAVNVGLATVVLLSVPMLAGEMVHAYVNGEG